MAEELSPAQIREFREQGFLVIPGAFDGEEVALMRREADFILELIVNSSLANKRHSRRLDVKRQQGRLIVRKIQPIIDLSVPLARFSRDRRLLAPLEQLMGDEPVLMEEKLNYKQPLPEELPVLVVPEIDDRFPVHNDWAYYSAQDYPQSILSSAITFDACTPQNGPIRVWPGSHLEHRDHEQMELGLHVKAGLIDFDGGEEVLAPAGSVMLFHTLLVHSSLPNTSGRPRRMMIYSHYPRAAKMGFDARNGPLRLWESPHEWRYQRAVASGEYSDEFKAPSYQS